MIPTRNHCYTVLEYEFSGESVIFAILQGGLCLLLLIMVRKFNDMVKYGARFPDLGHVGNNPTYNAYYIPLGIIKRSSNQSNVLTRSNALSQSDEITGAAQQTQQQTQ